MENYFNQYKNYLEQLNNETEEHCLRVAEKCKTYADVENVDKELAYKIGLLHDIGKIFIPSRILKKNCNLTVLERQLIDLHSYFGFKMLKDNEESSDVYMPVLLHHGFGKTKLEIVAEPVTEKQVRLTRLVHTIDILDAMTQKRVYHEAAPLSKVIEILKNDELCDIKLIEKIKEIEPE